jgi:hypothetical protein
MDIALFNFITYGILQLNNLSASNLLNFFGSFFAFLSLILILLMEIKAAKEIINDQKSFSTIENAILNFSKYEVFLGVYDYSEAI